MLAQPQLPAGCWGGALPAPSPIAWGLNAKPSSDADLVGQGLLSEACCFVRLVFSLIFTAWNSRWSAGAGCAPILQGLAQGVCSPMPSRSGFPMAEEMSPAGSTAPCPRVLLLKVGSTFGIFSSSSWKSETPQKAPQAHGAAPRGGRSASPRVPVGPRSSPSCPISLLTTAPTSPAAAPSPPRP